MRIYPVLIANLMNPRLFFKITLHFCGKDRSASLAPPGIRTQLAPGLLCKQLIRLCSEAAIPPANGLLKFIIIMVEFTTCQDMFKNFNILITTG